MAKNEDKLSNFLPINRSFFNHWLWTEERVFSNAEAFLWLIEEARFEAAVATMLIGGKMIKWNRGEIPASLRYLADTWKWEKNRVDRFLKKLEAEKMISRRLENCQTIIRLTNYDAHNSKKGQQTGHLKSSPVSNTEELRDTKRDSDGTATGQWQDKTNIVNKGEEGKEEHPDAKASHTLEDQQKFTELQAWMCKYASKVLKMEEQLTLNEFVKLIAKMSSKDLCALILQMHNWKPLLKKNVSVYRTILNWKKMAEERETPQASINQNDYLKQRERDEQRTKELSNQ